MRKRYTVPKLVKAGKVEELTQTRDFVIVDGSPRGTAPGGS